MDRAPGGQLGGRRFESGCRSPIISNMEISINYNFGEPLKFPSEIKINLAVSITLEDMWQLPDIREAVAKGVLPILRHLNMPEERLDEWKERIMLSGRLAADVKPPFRYLTSDHLILDTRDKKLYPVSDWLEGKLPD